MEIIVLLKIENGITLEARSEIDLAPENMCVFAKDYYNDVAEVVRILDKPSVAANSALLPRVLRIATVEDLARAAQNASEHRRVIATTQEWVDKLKLDMKLVNAHYAMDRKLVTVQFCADGRVDFRELVKELSKALCTRIELRQIGVRDETSMYGGIGGCGQPLCCCKFLHEFSSINVKMAKEQDLALTPSSISGICGRLKCCLKFEYDGYKKMAEGMPRRGEHCETPRGNGKIVDRNLLTRKVTVSFEGGGSAVFDISDIKTTQRAKPDHAGQNPRKKDGKKRA